MDVIPVLSTVILIATLITLIVAVASYLVFRIKEKKKAQEKANNPDAHKEAPTDPMALIGLPEHVLPPQDHVIKPLRAEAQAKAPQAVVQPNPAPVNQYPNRQTVQPQPAPAIHPQHQEHVYFEKPPERRNPGELSMSQAAFMESMGESIQDQLDREQQHPHRPEFTDPMKFRKFNFLDEEDSKSNGDSNQGSWR